MINNPKKIAIFGFPASGKSTFASILNKKYNIPVYSLDIIRWTNVENGKKDEKYFIEEYKKIINLDEWIIEGNALDYIDSRLDKADILYFFDTGVDESVKNFLQREERINNKQEQRIAFEVEVPVDISLEWIKNRYSKKIENLKPILNEYSDKLIVIHNYEELNNEINKLK